MKKPKILFFDIETSPNIGYSWGRWEQNIISFQKEWEILSFAWKFQGKKTVRCLTRADFKDKTDKSLVRMLRAVLNAADVVVAHNGDQFDVKKSTARMIYHGFSPTKPLKSIDTKKIAKKYFNFNSNSLNDLGTYLGLGKKLNTGGFDLWLGCMANDKKSWATMAKYNKQDVVLLEKVYDKFRPWIHNHPNVAKLYNIGECPKCTSPNVVKRGIRANTAGLQQQMLCNDCKGWYLTRYKK
jgi:uncharacterized protein YprB with RNaseH-like and TPR domain